MATVIASYIPAAGRAYVTLTSWAGTTAFTTTPVAGDQIEAPNGITVANDGTVTGADGVYTLRHIRQTGGGIEAVDHTVGSGDAVAPQLTNPVATRTAPDSIQATVDTDEANGTLYALLSENATETNPTIKATGDAQVVNALGTQTVTYTGLPLGMTYYVHFVHVDASNNESAAVKTAAVRTRQTATTTATVVVGSSRNLATLVDPIEPYLFQEWSRNPVASEQLIAQASSGSFDRYGNFETELEAILPIWFVELDGTIHRLTIDTTGLASAQDTKPAPFSFTAKTDVARSLAQTSNTITVQDIDAGLDIPVSVTGGTYSVSVDAGNTWGLWTSDPGTVKLNDRIRVQHPSADTYNTAKSTTLTIGPTGNSQSATFTTTTLADTVKPTISLVGGNVTLVQGTPYDEPGYTANDNADGNLTMAVVVTGTIDEDQLGPQTLTYTVTDAAGNSTSTTRTVTVVAFVPDDQVPPTIQLTGGNRTIDVGEPWVEPGYSAYDAVDGDLTDQVVITGTVNINAPGPYVLTYRVTDAAGNVTTATRIVTVVAGVDYPFTAAAPASRTYVCERTYRPELGEGVFILKAGETLDFDFDLTAWLAEQGDALAAAPVVSVPDDTLALEAYEQIGGLDRVKVWLGDNNAPTGKAYPVRLSITTATNRTAVFQFRVVTLDTYQ
ncbi:immunoglobulin-like domain-containing protein [Marinobacter sp.]|uniref:immunoglobulin-like domain-containing protein n=1 Tax=Marinobacter sp. TaxID=50741 RepID=UPI003A950926